MASSQKEENGTKTSMRNIIKLGNITGIENPMNHSMEEVQKNIIKAKKQ